MHNNTVFLLAWSTIAAWTVISALWALYRKDVLTAQRFETGMWTMFMLVSVYTLYAWINGSF